MSQAVTRLQAEGVPSFLCVSFSPLAPSAQRYRGVCTGGPSLPSSRHRGWMRRDTRTRAHRRIASPKTRTYKSPQHGRAVQKKTARDKTARVQHIHVRERTTSMWSVLTAKKANPNVECAGNLVDSSCPLGVHQKTSERNQAVEAQAAVCSAGNL